MEREKAVELLHEFVKDEKMRVHCLASEAVLRAMAERLGEDQEKWGLAGLLHDIDVELTNADPKRHALEARNILSRYNLDPEIIDAIEMHNEMATGRERETVFQHALSAGETITGLVYATTLVYPAKKIASVKSKSVVKRMKEKAFAASVNRDHILECEKIGIPLPEFAELAVNAMRQINDEIGL
jgi:uncharacterized protein